MKKKKRCHFCSRIASKKIKSLWARADGKKTIKVCIHCYKQIQKESEKI